MNLNVSQIKRKYWVFFIITPKRFNFSFLKIRFPRSLKNFQYKRFCKSGRISKKVQLFWNFIWFNFFWQYLFLFCMPLLAYYRLKPFLKPVSNTVYFHSVSFKSRFIYPNYFYNNIGMLFEKVLTIITSIIWKYGFIFSVIFNVAICRNIIWKLLYFIFSTVFCY